MTGRYQAPGSSAQFHRDRMLADLEAKARPRYFHEAAFHAKVTVAVRVLDAMFQDADAEALSRAALLVLAAVEEGAPPVTGPMDPAAVAALMGNLQGQAPILYASGHGVKADHNGDPVCVCGWDPVRELPPEVRRTQMDALRQVNAHAALEAKSASGWD